jgi:hypothetical protein
MEVPAVNPRWRKSSHSHNGGTACIEVGAIPWRKSSYSDNGGTACIEVATFPWRKSSHSDNGGSACVEAASAPGAVLVRDTTQHGAGPVLRLAAADWARFTTTLAR